MGVPDFVKWVDGPVERMGCRSVANSGRASLQAMREMQQDWHHGIKHPCRKFHVELDYTWNGIIVSAHALVDGIDVRTFDAKQHTDHHSKKLDSGADQALQVL